MAKPKKLPTSLKLQIVAGKNLAPKDANGKSDPYCVIHVYDEKGDQKKQLQSKTTVKLATLEPQWKEDFQFQLDTSFSMVKIEVWDWDQWTKDDFMGEVDVRLADFLDKPPKEEEFLLKQRKGKKKEIVSGELVLIVEYLSEQKKAALEEERKLLKDASVDERGERDLVTTCDRLLFLMADHPYNHELQARVIHSWAHAYHTGLGLSAFLEANVLLAESNMLTNFLNALSNFPDDKTMRHDVIIVLGNCRKAVKEYSAPMKIFRTIMSVMTKHMDDIVTIDLGLRALINQTHEAPNFCKYIVDCGGQTLFTETHKRYGHSPITIRRLLTVLHNMMAEGTAPECKGMLDATCPPIATEAIKDFVTHSTIVCTACQLLAGTDKKAVFVKAGGFKYLARALLLFSLDEPAICTIISTITHYMSEGGSECAVHLQESKAMDSAIHIVQRWTHKNHTSEGAAKLLLFLASYAYTGLGFQSAQTVQGIRKVMDHFMENKEVLTAGCQLIHQIVKREGHVQSFIQGRGHLLLRHSAKFMEDAKLRDTVASTIQILESSGSLSVEELETIKRVVTT